MLPFVLRGSGRSGRQPRTGAEPPPAGRWAEGMNHHKVGFHRYSTDQRLSRSPVGLYRGPSRDTPEPPCSHFAAPSRPVPLPGHPQQLAAAAGQGRAPRPGRSRPGGARRAPREPRPRAAAPACRWRSAPPAPPARPDKPGCALLPPQRQRLLAERPLPFPPLPSAPALVREQLRATAAGRGAGKRFVKGGG